MRRGKLSGVRAGARAGRSVTAFLDGFAGAFMDVISARPLLR
jgi:hypothetical protein